MKSWYIYFVVMMAICSLGCNRTASKKQVMQIGPADAQCLNCDTLGTTVRMNMIQNHYPLDTKKNKHDVHSHSLHHCNTLEIQQV